MKAKELLKVNVNNIKKEQHDAVKLEVINKLLLIVDCIKRGDYENVLNMLGESPAGDGYGIDNSFIEFNDIIIPSNPEGVGEPSADIEEAMRLLISLRD